MSDSTGAVFGVMAAAVLTIMFVGTGYPWFAGAAVGFFGMGMLFGMRER